MFIHAQIAVAAEGLVTVSPYNLPADMLLWERADDFVPLDAARVAAALSA